MTNNRDVTVVIATAGDLPFLLEACRSALNQDQVSLDLILIDYGDGSAMCLAQESDLPFSQVIKAPHGASKASALNWAIGCANTQFVAILDGDDVWMPGKLGAQIAIMASNPKIGILGTQFCRFGSWGGPSSATHFPTTPDSLAASLARGIMPMLQSSMLIRRSVFLQCRGYNEACLKCEDLEFLIRASKYTKMANLDKPYVRYRVASPGQSWSYWRRNEEWRQVAVRLATGSQIGELSKSRRFWWRNLWVWRLLPYYFLARVRDGRTE